MPSSIFGHDLKDVSANLENIVSSRTEAPFISCLREETPPPSFSFSLLLPPPYSAGGGREELLSSDLSL
jgi:hypothetical protein